MKLRWFFDHGIGLIGPLFFLAYSLVPILRPDIALRWLEKAYPGRDLDTPDAYRFTKSLGVLLFACAAFFLLFQIVG
jgi:hypothetical protein